jgi:hypothetical protein
MGRQYHYISLRRTETKTSTESRLPRLQLMRGFQEVFATRRRWPTRFRINSLGPKDMP